MSNSYLYQFCYSYNPMLSMVQLQASIGAAGAVDNVAGNGIDSVTHLGTGLYQIKMLQGFPRFLSGSFEMLNQVAPGANVADGSFSIGTAYIITAVGTTDFNAIGVPSDVTPVVGLSFVATGIGGAGTGTAKALTSSGVASVEELGDPQAQIKNGYINIACYDYAGALANPASGSVLSYVALLRNSSLLAKGEV